MNNAAGISAYKLQCVGCVIPIGYYVRSPEIYLFVAFGFLPGKEVKEAKIGNLGLQDREFAYYGRSFCNTNLLEKSVSH